MSVRSRTPTAPTAATTTVIASATTTAPVRSGSGTGAAGATLAALAVLVLFSSRGAHACAGCRNPNMPITRLEAVHLAPGQVRAAAIAAGTALRVVHPAGCADAATCTEVPVQPTYLHDQRILPGELRAVAEVGIWRSLGAELHAPFRLTRTTITYQTPQGGPYQPLDPGVHHRDETLAGIGDPWLLARWNTSVAGALVTARAGVSLPLGRTEANPFTPLAAGRPHQHIQFGTGTVDPVLGFDVTRQFGKLQFAGYAQGQSALYQNRHGFRAGTRWLGGVMAGSRLAGSLTGGLGADLLHEGAERWEGRIQQDGNLGRTEVLAGMSLVYSVGPTAFGVTARVPVWRRIITGTEAPGSLSSPVMVSAVVSRTFGNPP